MDLTGGALVSKKRVGGLNVRVCPQRGSRDGGIVALRRERLQHPAADNILVNVIDLVPRRTYLGVLDSGKYLARHSRSLQPAYAGLYTLRGCHTFVFVLYSL
jgi:hypothetical protein